ncbi:MAG: hypothetical protein ABIH46_07865 [Chloroflexota bacterium]
MPRSRASARTIQPEEPMEETNPSVVEEPEPSIAEETKPITKVTFRLRKDWRWVNAQSAGTLFSKGISVSFPATDPRISEFRLAIFLEEI